MSDLSFSLTDNDGDSFKISTDMADRCPVQIEASSSDGLSQVCVFLPYRDLKALIGFLQIVNDRVKVETWFS